LPEAARQMAFKEHWVALQFLTQLQAPKMDL
jgi:hypothetical protein